MSRKTKPTHKPLIPPKPTCKPLILPKPAHFLQHVTTDKSLTGNTKRSPPTVTSASFDLKDFEREFLLPQLVSVTAGCYGDMEQSSMCEDDELMLLFTKTTKTIVACRGGENYDIPLNSAFEISLCNESSNHNYDTIKDLLAGNKELPAVARVCKSHKGNTRKSSVVAGSLIFPKQLISSSGQKVLECTCSYSNETLQLDLSCSGNFSTHPSDVKMSFMQYIIHIGVFPVKVKVFKSRNFPGERSYVELTGAEFVLDRRRVVHSYICTKDIFGENGYPIFELPMQTPVSIKCVKRDDVDMSALINKAKATYMNFDLSLVSEYFTFCEQPSRTEIQSEFCTKVDLYIDKVSNYYDLTKPAIESAGFSESNDYVYMSHIPEVIKDDCPQGVQQSPIQLPVYRPLGVTIPQYPYSMAVENKTYLQSLAVADILKLLDAISLSQYKDNFKKEKVNGMLFESLTAKELKELGVTKGIHQKRLLLLIDGKESVKKLLQNEEEHEYDYVTFPPK